MALFVLLVLLSSLAVGCAGGTSSCEKQSVTGPDSSVSTEKCSAE